MYDVAGAAGLKSDATIKFRTTWRTWRDTAARDNQIEDDMEDVERYCSNCAVQGGVHVVQGPRRR